MHAHVVNRFLSILHEYFMLFSCVTCPMTADGYTVFTFWFYM